MTAEEIARYNESLLCVPGEAARLRDLTRLRGRDVRWGVSVRRTSLRAKPTDALCPTRAGDRYDDPLQLTAVLPNEPMALLGESADGSFCRAETSYMRAGCRRKTSGCAGIWKHGGRRRRAVFCA